MDAFEYRNGQLFCEDVSLSELAKRTGTPGYVYSRRTFEQQYRAAAEAFAELEPELRYSVKSCGNLSILKVLHECGAGMDVVSGGELYRALAAGVKAERICFAGVGKSDREIEEAIQAGVGFFNVESEQELETIEQTARALGKRARVAVRINPDVGDKKTHVKTNTGVRGTKFGIDSERVPAVFEAFAKSPHLELKALHVHIGSPIYGPEPYLRALDKVLSLMETLRQQGHAVDTLNLGGGFMASYGLADAPERPWREFADPMAAALRPFMAAGGRILLEPGRKISANAAVLLTRVLYTKRCGDRNVVVVDTGMTHLARPALYDAEHFMWPVAVREGELPSSRDPRQRRAEFDVYDVVGPICESSDRLGEARSLPKLARGDLLAIFSAGAYGMVMASQYNAVPRPPEVLVSGQASTLIRRRESYEDLVALELSTSAI
ncbi:MAG: diaminopimelate decarboxylase [Myxococcaceae bacterium]|nr:diaminopimelate decarboxylase [Myxococcaceae bacterium]